METRKMNAPRAMYLASISASIHESLPSPPPLHLHSILPHARCRCHRMHAVSSSAHPAALSTMPPPFPRPSNGGLHAWILKRGQLAVGEGLSEEEGGRPGMTTVAGVVVGLSWIWLAVRWGLIQGSATPRRVSIHPPLAHPLPAVARTDGRGGARLPRQSGSARIDWDLGRGDLEKARGKSWWTLWTDGNSET